MIKEKSVRKKTMPKPRSFRRGSMKKRGQKMTREEQRNSKNKNAFKKRRGKRC
jgi:hypothetical protein